MCLLIVINNNRNRLLFGLSFLFKMSHLMA